MAAASEEQRAWAARVLEFRLSEPPSTGTAAPQATAGTSEPSDPPPLTGMAAWSSARAEAVAALKAAEVAVRNYQHPDSDSAVIELRAVRANLTAEPTTEQQIAELEAYLSTDDVVAEAEGENGLGVTLKLREPLLAALATLRKGLSGGSGEAGGARG